MGRSNLTETNPGSSHLTRFVVVVWRKSLISVKTLYLHEQQQPAKLRTIRSTTRLQMKRHLFFIAGVDHELIVPHLCIKCTECNNYSHIACQRNGSASSTKKSFKFRCHFCEPPSQLIGVTRSQPQKRVKKQADKPPGISLAKRLLPGKGALARHGKYWYPVRLLFKEPGGWMVKWWRGNRFIEPQAPPSKVADSDLRDELWANPGARRQICLGEWEHACETPTDEDLILEFRQAPKLLANPDGDYPTVPASVSSRAQKNAKGKCFETLHQGGVPYTGELSSSDCARVANWFYNYVPMRVPAGCAGNRQWGLVGPHQNGWNPYADIPAHWNHEDRNDENHVCWKLNTRNQTGPSYVLEFIGWADGASASSTKLAIPTDGLDRLT
ncbi:hypothetical protein B0H11DRAFT_1931750 [Mycena galericulata]|nr:hypothetical protein B0H11DRAFT_1931750 [Mycena galericulata]